MIRQIVPRLLVALVVFMALMGGACGRSMQPRVARAAQLDSAISDSAFAALSALLSEEGGYFDTDNLISNESAYLQVISALRDGNVGGGAYVGVGPGQNFSYIAQVRPRIAFIVDIRRDNLLQHLMYKALFEASPDRLSFLGLLLGRDISQEQIDAAQDGSIEELISVVDAAPRTESSVSTSVQTVIEGVIGSGIPLSADDLATIERFHREFIGAGFALRFHSYGRAPQSYYPTFRRLLLEVDLEGQRRNYLASEDAYGFLRGLEERNLVVPVVGNLAGPNAIRAIGNWLTETNLEVSAFYTSNVEFYLWQEGSFGAFVGNLSQLPRGRSSVIIRSYFGGGFRRRPGMVAGYANAQMVQSMDDFLEEWEDGRYLTYLDLVRQ
jgi:hypothetical protein